MFTERTKIRIAKVIITLIVILILAGNQIIHSRKSTVEQTVSEIRDGQRIRCTIMKNDGSGEKLSSIYFSPAGCTLLEVEKFAEMFPDTFNRHYDMLNQPDKGILVFDVIFYNDLDKETDIVEATKEFTYLTQADGVRGPLVYMEEYRSPIIDGKVPEVIRFAAVAGCDAKNPDSYDKFINKDVCIVITRQPIERRLVFDKITKYEADTSVQQ